MRPEDSVSHETNARLHLYKDLLIKWQKAINLISPGTVPQIWERHFEDSLQLLPYIPCSGRLVDLGSGAGFPGLVLAACRADLEVHLIESDMRKAQFLKTVSRETGIPAQVHNERVEVVLTDLKPDIVTARAFAALVDIFDYAVPAVQAHPALRFVLPKGRSWREEVAAAQERFSFVYEAIPSQTDPQGVILLVSDLRPLGQV